MKNNRNDRHGGFRRNGNDHDFAAPSFFENSGYADRSAPMSGSEIQGTVKWFNTERGFGFVGLNDGSGDVFLHINNVTEKGYDAPQPGTTVRVRVGNGAKGRQVVELIDLDESTATPDADPRNQGGPRPARPRFPAPDMSSAQEVTGTVKWYNGTKGFGFIAPDNGDKDVFVHASSLERSGVPALAEGQSVTMKVAQGAKGPEAIQVSTR